MIVQTEIAPCREVVRSFQRNGRTVGLVPTMGALHDGHLSLVHQSRQQCFATAVTIFVNPTQFGRNEDLTAYPRTLEADLAACESEAVDLVFAPPSEVVYPGDEQTNVHVGRIAEILCGPSRPGHFDGVATIVLKLFNTLPADRAFFGEKDYQQLVVIQRMVRDLNVPIEIVGCPTVREPDGLAMSSRNAYLSADERRQAVVLIRSLCAAAVRIKAGQVDAAEIVDGIRRQIAAAGPCEIQYIDIVDAAGLEILTTVNRPARICLAVKIGSCRLIDNVGVDVPPGAG